MGRHPVPLEKRKALGNPGKRPYPETRHEFIPESIPAIPPIDLGLGPAGETLWTHVAGLNWVSTSDVAMLVRACRLADIVDLLDDDIDQNGVSYVSRGRSWPNPSIAQRMEVEKRLGAYLGAFGLTPSDRVRLGIAESKAQSKFDELMEKRAQRQQEHGG